MRSATDPSATYTLIATPTRLHPTGKCHQSYIVSFDVLEVLDGLWGDPTLSAELYHDFGGRQLLDDLGVESYRASGGWSAAEGQPPFRVTVRPRAPQPVHSMTAQL